MSAHSGQITNAITRPHLVNDSTLHVVAVISNTARYHSRYRIFREWEQAMLATANVQLYVVELAYGDRNFEVTSADNPNHLQLRTGSELWHKEAMVNAGVRYLLPLDWRYMAWIDADVWFANKDWALETIHALQHHPVVQPWSEVIDLGPEGDALQMFRSFASFAARGVKQQARKSDEYPFGHCGFAWACTRTFWENAFGLMDFAILGSADHHMAWALLNQVDESVDSGMSDGYKELAHEWQQRAVSVTHGHLGYVQGRIEHHFHGPKGRRYYRERRQFLINAGYDPKTDLRRDNRGLPILVGKPDLAEQIHRYMGSRHEDSIERE